jgi:hypothetical protein
MSRSKPIHMGNTTTLAVTVFVVLSITPVALTIIESPEHKI